MAGTELYILTPLDWAAIYLQRVSYDGECPGMPCHLARVRIEDQPIRWRLDEHGHQVWQLRGALEPDIGDPRQPGNCQACNRIFQARDPWQLFADRLHARAHVPMPKPIVGSPPVATEAWGPGAVWPLSYREGEGVAHLAAPTEVRTRHGDFLVDRACTLPALEGAVIGGATVTDGVLLEP